MDNIIRGILENYFPGLSDAEYERRLTEIIHQLELRVFGYYKK